MLQVHRAERADRLADGLAEVLLDALDDPFQSDVVAVPTRGIERWLTQRLSLRLGSTDHDRSDGICANVKFPFPGRLIQAALAAAAGIDAEQDPWLPERSVWPLLRVVDRCLSDPWLNTLERHLDGARAGGNDPARRFGVVRHIADLFDRYGVHRPDMVRAWAHGSSPRGHGWQPELWRRLRAEIGVPSPAERLAPECDRIVDDPGLLDLPARLALFGLTRMPRAYLDVLAAIAAHREVNLFVLHPSPALWRRIRADGEAPVRRYDDRTAGLAENRLLASWGRDARELQLVIAAAGDATEHHHELPSVPGGSLLSRIQDDVRHDRQPPGPPLPGEPDHRATLDLSDESIQIHACHGRARQVEVLRDAILHLLEDDPTLEPRDVIVMCPDIETFAPLIQATFGARATGEGDEHENGLPDLRVRLADRSLRQTNPVLGVVSQLLALADQRATASQLLDLAAREPVRRRFGFDDDDLARMQEWVAASGVRWGFDAPHREPFKLAGLEVNTWRAGLDRILVGVTMTEDDRPLVGGVLPLDDVESGAIQLAGRFAEFVDRSRTALDELGTAKPIDAWTTAIGEAADALTATSECDSWQRRELRRLLEAVRTESGEEGAVLELGDVRALLADRLRGRPTRANFRTGHLTVCTLVPMRSVPHRVVCILGLDDGEFPRRTRRDGDDLMLHEPHVGDRDPRAEDRQMMLDALLAATERLIITYTGNDERTNLRRPPAVPVGELLDVVDRTVSCPGDRPRERIITQHPLQPFDARNFTDGRLIAGGPWGFDRHALRGARARGGVRQTRPPFLAEPLTKLDTPVIELNSLVRFAEQPIRTFLRDRLGISVSDYRDEVRDGMPVELDNLEQWAVGQRLLEGVMGGAELGTCLRAEIARGTLPPGQLGRPPLLKIGEAVAQLAEAAGSLGGETPESLDVNLALGDGRLLAGTVTGVCGEVVRTISYSRVRPRDRLRAWIKLLALTAARPERPFQSAVIGRLRSGSQAHADVTLARVAPLAPTANERRSDALDQLNLILDLYDRGMCEPLPMACDTSAAHAQEGREAAEKAWTSTFDYDKEDRRPEHLLAFGGQIPFTALMAMPRFEHYAYQLWDGLLAREAIEDR
jgi:exodeoxyribonuclease V gamma subunit